MNRDEAYVISYLDYLKRNYTESIKYDRDFTNWIFSISDRNKSINVLDIACGNGVRTLEFYNMFLSHLHLNVNFWGQDINQAWKTHWLENMQNNSFKRFWLKHEAERFEWHMIHCSHGFYFPEVREKIFSLFDNNSCKFLIVRAGDKKSFFEPISRMLEVEGEYTWEDELLKYLKEKRYEYYTVNVNMSARFPVYRASEYANWIATILGKEKQASEIYRFIIDQHMDNLTREPDKHNGSIVKLTNNDVIYIITKIII